MNRNCVIIHQFTGDSYEYPHYGGAGYIGSATAEALIKAGHAVTVYDSLVTGHKRPFPSDATLVQADYQTATP